MVANPLWDFAVDVYDREGVTKACLALQNRFGADVNMILFLLWLADSGIGQANLARYMGTALKLSRDWQRNFVEPLRTARNNLKTYVEANLLSDEQAKSVERLRQNVLTSELDMERMQMLALFNIVSDERQDAEDVEPHLARERAANSLNVYFSATGVALDPLGKSHVATILDAAFGG